MTAHSVFITGGTGYIGRPLVDALLKRGHEVKVLVRPSSDRRLPKGCQIAVGDPLDARSFYRRIPPSDTFIQLVGVPHPSPAKAHLFRQIDLVSLEQSVDAAMSTEIAHFIYVSVAHPAPVMKAYQAVRSEGEDYLRRSMLKSTVLRPWYVLGPGHWWPLFLLPAYWLAGRVARYQEPAQRLGLMTLDQMVNALVASVENPSTDHWVLEVPEMRKLAQGIDPAA